MDKTTFEQASKYMQSLTMLQSVSTAADQSQGLTEAERQSLKEVSNAIAENVKKRMDAL